MPSLGDWINEMPRALMVPATAAAYVTYRAAFAGQTLMVTKFPASYAWFRLLNAVAFYTSITILLLLSSRRFYSTPARMAALRLIAVFDLLCVVAVYAIGSSPEDPLRGLANLLPGVLICVLVYSGVVIGDWATRKLRSGDAASPRRGTPATGKLACPAATDQAS